MPASPGQQFEGSVWAYSPSGDSILGNNNFTNITLSFVNSAGTVIGSVNFSPGTNEKNTPIFDGRDPNMPQNQWIEYTVNAVAPAGTAFVRESLFFIQLNNQGGAVWFDNASLNLLTPDVVAVPGDYNKNGIVDAADYVVYRKTLGQTGAGLPADGNGNGYRRDRRLHFLASPFRKHVRRRQLVRFLPPSRNRPHWASALFGLVIAAGIDAAALLAELWSRLRQAEEEQSCDIELANPIVGFTLVELLVVIAIIGILVALLLACNSSGARSSQASLLYEQSQKPRAGSPQPSRCQKTLSRKHGLRARRRRASDVDQPCAGWILNTLPQLEEQPLYDQFQQGGAFEGTYTAQGGGCRQPKLGRGMGSIKNGISVPALMQTQLSILQCPSDASVSSCRTYNTNLPAVSWR